jgi:hypothetical protein
MTLPVYGNPLTMQQIATEFSSGTVYPMNQYYAGGSYVPAATKGYPSGGGATSIPSSGTITMNNFFGASKVVGYGNYWYWTFQGSSAPQSDLNVMTGGGYDSSNNVYMGGTWGGGISSPYAYPFVVKFSSIGIQQWVTGIYYGDSAKLYSVGSVVDPSTGNTYVLTSGATNALVKITNTGSIAWNKVVGLDIGPLESICFDSNGYVIVGGTATDASGNGTFNVYKFDTNGNAIWQRQIGSDANIIQYKGAVTVDSSGNISCIFQSQSSTLGAVVYYCVLNSSGTLTTNNLYYAGTYYNAISGQYIIAASYGSSIYYGVPFNLVSNGSTVYQFGKIGSGAYTLNLTNSTYPALTGFNGMGSDSSGNLYVNYFSPTYGSSYVKINSAGTSYTQYVNGSLGSAVTNFSYGPIGFNSSYSNMVLGTNNTSNGLGINVETNGTNYTTASELSTALAVTLTLGTSALTNTTLSLSFSSNPTISANTPTFYSQSVNALT